MWAAQFREMGLSMYPCEDTSWKRDITRKEENVIEERIVIRLVEKIVKLSSDNVAVNLRIFVRPGSGRYEHVEWSFSQQADFDYLLPMP